MEEQWQVQVERCCRQREQLLQTHAQHDSDNFQLPQTDPRDVLRTAHRVIRKAECDKQATVPVPRHLVRSWVKSSSGKYPYFGDFPYYRIV